MKQRIGLVAALTVLTMIVLVAVWLRAGDTAHPPGVAAGPAPTTPTPASAPTPSTAGSPISPTSTAGPPSTTPAVPPVTTSSTFQIRPLAPGERPPQFILFSFDGAGSPAKWAAFSDIARPLGAHFTGFLSGVYLLANSAKSSYAGPGHAAGKSSIGFGGSPQDVAGLVQALNTAKADGNEIGTHYNGHFCAGSPPSGRDWTTQQWSAEIDQFLYFLEHYSELAPVPGPKEALIN